MEWDPTQTFASMEEKATALGLEAASMIVKLFLQE